MAARRDSEQLVAFEALPGSACVGIGVVRQLFAISRATVWRWVKSEALPRPIRIGGSSRWNVHELREKLRVTGPMTESAEAEPGVSD
jgi:predicted DNA-binding transcriptional regulator AlpA